MAYAKVNREFVIRNAKYIILKIDQIDAIEADRVIDRLMQRKTFFTRRPIYASRTECIKQEQDFGNGALYYAFSPRRQKIKCEELLFAAQNCQEDTLFLTEEDISTLGFNNVGGVEYLQHFWDVKDEEQ